MHPDGKVHGGTALIIRSCIKHEIDKHRRYFLQITSIVVEAWNGCITISIVYLPPKDIIKNKQYIIFLETLGNHFITAGNYNAKHTQ